MSCDVRHHLMFHFITVKGSHQTAITSKLDHTSTHWISMGQHRHFLRPRFGQDAPQNPQIRRARKQTNKQNNKQTNKQKTQTTTTRKPNNNIQQLHIEFHWFSEAILCSRLGQDIAAQIMNRQIRKRAFAHFINSARCAPMRQSGQFNEFSTTNISCIHTPVPCYRFKYVC